MLTSVELCAGAGGQALGLELAGFEHVALIENDPHACRTLRQNRRRWNVVEDDVHNFSGTPFDGVDLVAGGVPCPPFSVAGHQLGKDDDRDLFPQAIRIIRESRPKAVMLENVRGLLSPGFNEYRATIVEELEEIGYSLAEWRLLNASGFGVPQLRPRSILVALAPQYADHFIWPEADASFAPTVGETLYGLMAERGWQGATAWARGAHSIAPTLVGGSKKHGGPDLGPTRARQAWAKLGVDGRGLADEAPNSDFEGMPRLTVKMAAKIQGFPESWVVTGRKTAAYRQIGNAFPPPVAQAVGQAIAKAIRLGDRAYVQEAAWVQSTLASVFSGPRWGDPHLT